MTERKSRMREPLVITKLKKLNSLVSYADISYQHNFKNFTVYDSGSESSSYPRTYEGLLIELDHRIAEAEAANDK